ncbi:MAG: hypothetical protein KDA57_04550 [Planctomycetales bacterium]|nr:hypothetical protein [Planctomycetales bacterium]
MSCRPLAEFSRWVFFLILSVVAADLCRATDAPPAHLDPVNEPALLLEEYHFFQDGRRQIPNTRVIPYELNTPHFADYARLQRFLWLPLNSSIAYHESGDLEYPLGAVLILTVSYLNDLRDPALGEDLIETRLLIHREQGWQAAQYHWNQEETEARLSVTGMQTDVFWTHYDGTRRSHTYTAPNQNHCKQCHELDGAMVPLGPTSADRINRPFQYADGAENQLTRWSKLGYLIGAPDDPEDVARMAVWDDPSTGTVEQRAKAYLEMNCSSCHRPQGIAYTSGLDLTFVRSSPVKYGVYKAPVAAGRGVGHGRFAIDPGRPERSFLVHRLRSTDPGVRMPIVGRELCHEEGAALVEQWIEQMHFAELAAAQSQADRHSIFRFTITEEPDENDSQLQESGSQP